MLGKTKDADELTAALMEELRYLRGTQTELIAHLRSQVVNGVLEAATLPFDVNGQLYRSYNAACGSVIISNPAATPVTVTSGGASGDVAPKTGRGLLIVPATSWLPVPIAAHSFTVYGVAANVVGFVAFTGMQAFGRAR